MTCLPTDPWWKWILIFFDILTCLSLAHWNHTWLNNHEDMGQYQGSFCTTHHLMLVIICTKYGRNPSRTVCALERIRQNVPYFSSVFEKSSLNDIEDISEGHRSLCATRPLMIAIKSTWYGNNPPRTVNVTERTQHTGRTDGVKAIYPQQLRFAV